MKALIEGWRKVWGCDFPFYFVQIAPYAGLQAGHLPPLWEAQVASLKIPGTGMAVTTDLVENIKNIHPKNKFDVGNRLALWALAKDYGKKDLVYSGPLYKAMKVEGEQDPALVRPRRRRTEVARRQAADRVRDRRCGRQVRRPPRPRSTATRSLSRPRRSPRPPRPASAGGTWRIRTWSTRRACPPRRSRPTTGRAARASECGMKAAVPAGPMTSLVE